MSILMALFLPFYLLLLAFHLMCSFLYFLRWKYVLLIWNHIFIWKYLMPQISSELLFLLHSTNFNICVFILLSVPVSGDVNCSCLNLCYLETGHIVLTECCQLLFSYKFLSSRKEEFLKTYFAKRKTNNNKMTP